MKITQFLAKRIYNNRYIYIDYWSLLHFGLFFIIGMNYPNQWGLVIFGSVIFEIIEKKFSGKISFLREKINDTIIDFGFNFLGYWLGMLYIAGGLI